MPEGKLWAVSDLHAGFAENRKIVDGLYPESAEDWLIVAGDCAEMSTDIAWVLGVLAARWAKVLWCPGNHELWMPREDPLQLAGVERYAHLVEMCRGLGVVTPEDPYPVWTGPGGPATVAPLFLLYDYSFLTPGTSTPASPSTAPTSPVSSAPTSSCCAATPIPAAMPGAGPVWRRPRPAWQPCPRRPR